ncbi:MAG: dehydrogenase [Chloroflexi bacterium]|nr:dehydrogenase [Chloroflexota bacterium]
MTAPSIVAFLDPVAPEVRAAIEAEAPAGLTLLFATSTAREERLPIAARATVLVGGGGPLPGDLIEASPHLRLVHKWGIGVDKIDLDAAARRGVPVAITGGANAIAVAEYTLMLVLAVLRRLPDNQRRLQNDDFLGARNDARRFHRQLHGKIVGLVGLGAVGREVVARLTPFGVTICYFDLLRPSAEIESRLGVAYRPLDDLIAEVDVLSLHIPYLPANHHLLSRERIARLRPGAIVINTARGELVDEEALAEALVAGHLGGAGIDVFADEPIGGDTPLTCLRLPNLVVTPHLAGSAFDNVGNVARHIFANVGRVLTGEPIPARDLIRTEGVAVTSG